MIFNFGFLTTVPSWLNEKNGKVSVSKASWVSILLSLVMYVEGAWGELGNHCAQR